MAIKSFRELRVWQAGMDLAVSAYHVTEGFPKQETYGLSSQMQRAAVSVPSNIAEGHVREHTREYLHHVSIAQASLAELSTQIELARRLNYSSEDDLVRVQDELSAVSRQLY